MDNQYLTTREVFRFVNINEKRVYFLVSGKGLPATEVGERLTVLIPDMAAHCLPEDDDPRPR